MAARALRVLCRTAFATMVWAWICPEASAQTPALHTVLAIYWSTEDFPSNPPIDAAIRDALSRSSLPIDYFTEYLESDRFPGQRTSWTLREYIRDKYAGRRIDAVLAISDVALDFVLRERAELFPDAPVVYLGVTRQNATVRNSGAGLTGVVSGGGFTETLDLALKLHPSTRQVFVVAQAPDASLQDTMKETLQTVGREVTLEYLNTRTLATLIADVKAVPPQSVILYVRYSQEDPGHVLFPSQVAPLVAAAATVPVYGVAESYIGKGIVGGALVLNQSLGGRLGRITRQILEGTAARDIPIEQAALVPTFDWHQLQRWGIESSRLPQHSDVRFKVATAWESYRWYIIGTVIVLAAQLLLIVGLLTQRASRRRAEATVRTREATLRSSYERIRQLAGRLINAQEVTRANIARDLHDDVCQELIGVSIAVSSLKRSSGHLQNPNTQQALSQLEQWALGAVEGIRRLSHDLHPANLGLLGLAAALKAHCVEVEKRFDVQVQFTTDGDFGHVHPDIAVCLFRIAQEALRNGAVHGDARRLAVSLVRTRLYIELTVNDDGRGFDLEAVRRDGSGLGLVSMEERARGVSGRMRILTRLRQGTTIRVRVPENMVTPATKNDVEQPLFLVEPPLQGSPEPL